MKSVRIAQRMGGPGEGTKFRLLGVSFQVCIYVCMYVLFRDEEGGREGGKSVLECCW